MSRPLNHNGTNGANGRFTAVEVPKQDPSVRTKNFKEVVLGYTEEQEIGRASCRERVCQYV
jgi:hypothetical protein